MDFTQYVTNVESITIRRVPGAGDQLELVLRTNRVTMVVRTIGHKGKTIRVLDLRGRDTHAHKKSRFISVPVRDLAPKRS